MKVDARTTLIWRVRGTLGPEGHLLLANNFPRSPAEDADLRAQIVEAIAWHPAGQHPWADDRGLLAHARGQYVHEPPADVVSWRQVWELVSPGITSERTAELNGAWLDGAEKRDLEGQHTDMRLHLACCAFYDPVPAAVQLDLFDLIGAGAR